jgi:CheY-like chemotaxis protein
MRSKTRPTAPGPVDEPSSFRFEFENRHEETKEDLMSTTVLQRKRVLFVDDDAPFLEMIERIMSALGDASWEIFTAQNTGKAFATLQDNSINMVVIDVQMPVVDGLQFLTLLNRRYPNLQKVVMTGFANDNYRAACLSSGAEMFLEKPKTPEGFENLFATLNELIKWQPEEGFRGVLRRVGLQDVIQMECLSRNSSILEITARKETGRIYIQDGSIIHASLGDRTGEEALNHLLALRGGEFKLRSFAEPPARTIDGSWELLLMEAARLRDEIDSAGSLDPAADTGPAAQSQTAMPESETTKPAAVAEPISSTVTVESIPDLFPSPPIAVERPPSATQTTAPEAPAVEQAVEPLVTSDLAAVSEMEEDVEVPRRQIDEVLVCSSHGDVLYEWQCRNSDVWVNFLEFVSQKSRQVSQGFALGRFDRLEIESEGSRMIAQIPASGGVLVRSSAVADTTTSPQAE